MFMPAGCHLGSCLASAWLNDPLRSEPTIVMTLSLSAIFQILELYRPLSGAGCLTCGFQAGEALPCKACLHGRLSAIVALSPPCYRAANAGENDGWKCKKDRLDRHGPHGLPDGGAAAQGRS